ncbi:Peptidase C39 bacteriocin processing [Crenothrix polyspora]|uniref:Peptidase C39 bacteriocin processing n=1 Tax=Crenothrix polyspora TaxID=360316 RepID=A0A1R4H2D4_9GAMM|nr:cysteine peptidase family C39 domain-containing protein [Crenothrix polyspora]SJM90383.1 Peptidase C39 bacteriocin processing [Crenothrix polyspora]
MNVLAIIKSETQSLGMCRMKICTLSHLALLSVVLCTFFLSAAQANESRIVKSLLEMRRDRVVVQKWDLSCGAAALSTLLTYQLQDPTPEKEIAATLIKRKEYIEHPELIQIKEGFSLLDLKRFADQRGYEGIGLGKMEFADLAQYAPLMIPIKVNDYNHFVVFRGSMGNRVLLADPAWGNRTILTKKFLEAWIDYPTFGKVGFVIAQKNGVKLPNHLAPVPEDFVFLR